MSGHVSEFFPAPAPASDTDTTMPDLSQEKPDEEWLLYLAVMGLETLGATRLNCDCEMYALVVMDTGINLV